MLINLDPRQPLGQQVYQHLSRAIRAGELRAGARLPSSRRLAEELGVSRNTILFAYDRLLAEGYIEMRRAAGTFVSSSLPVERLPGRARSRRRQSTAAPRISTYGRRVTRYAVTNPQPDWPDAPEPRYHFGRGHTLSDQTSNHAWNQILRRRATELEAAPPAGWTRPESGPLPAALADYLRRTRGVDAAPEQVIMVTASQQSFQLTAQLLLDPGDRVVIEDPHYVGARNSFLSAGAGLIPVPVDRNGLAVESIPHRARGAKLVYTVPSQQWPTGVVMPLSRRLELLRWAAENDAYIIEDDCNCEYQHCGPPIESLQGIDRSGRVIYSGTLTRLLLPMHPVGFLVVPESLVDSYRALDTLGWFQPSAFEQAALAEFISDGHFERLVRRARRRNALVLRALHDAMQAHLAEHMEIFPGRAGFHLYGRFNSVAPAEVDELISRAAQVEVAFYPDHLLHLRPPERLGLILSIGELGPAEVEEGVSRLGRVLENWPPG